MKRVGWEIKNVFNEEEWRLNMECRSCISITCCCLSGDYAVGAMLGQGSGRAKCFIPSIMLAKF